MLMHECDTTVERVAMQIRACDAEVVCICRSSIVSQSTGCSQPELLERLYQHFAEPAAWDVYPGAKEALRKIRSSGMQLPHIWHPETMLLLASMLKS